MNRTAHPSRNDSRIRQFPAGIGFATRARHAHNSRRMMVAAAALVIGVTGFGEAAAAAQKLSVWDLYNKPPQMKVMKRLNKNFEAAHPDVTIDRTVRTFQDLVMTVKLAVSSGNGPVVTQVNQGAGDMGTMVKRHLLIPLDDYIGKYGWDKKQSQSVLARDRWSQSGEFGVGKTYGISSLGELVGLYYNMKVLKAAGIDSAPATYGDLLDDVKKLKSKGKVPLMIGTVSDNMALHMFAALSQAHIPASKRKALDKLVYGRGGTWNMPANVTAARQMQKWADDGDFYSGFQGISGDDAVQLFLANQGAFLISGSWYLGQMEQNPDIHFMAVPGPSDVKHGLVVGGVNLAWTITDIAKTPKQRDLAAQYINYMVSGKVAEIWANAGYLPAATLPKSADVKVPPLLGEALKVWKTTNDNNALGHYPDWASPTMLKTMSSNLQLLLSDKEKTDGFIAALNKDYKAYLASKSQ